MLSQFIIIFVFTISAYAVKFSSLIKNEKARAKSACELAAKILYSPPQPYHRHHHHHHHPLQIHHTQRLSANDVHHYIYIVSHCY